MLKVLWFVPVILLTIYAPIELTRVIINEFVLNLHTTSHWQFIAELSILWSFYVSAMVIIGRYLCLKSRKN